MTSRPSMHGRVELGRHLLAVGLALSVGYAFGIFTLAACGGSQEGFAPPADGQLPQRVVHKLEECGKRGPTALQPEKHTVSFDVFMDSVGHVEQVALRDSTFHLDEVEACMQDALQALSERAVEASLRRREHGPAAPISPQTRALLGNPVAIAVGGAEVVLVIGLMVVTVVLFYQVVHNTKPHPPPPALPQVDDPPAAAPPIAAATAQPSATAAPLPTVAPVATAVPKARRHPNQTCEDEELDRLEKEKDGLCKRVYAADCKQSRSNKMLERIHCSAIKLSIQQRRACLTARIRVQDKCFGGVPDAGHKKQIDDTRLGLNGCETQALVNCAKGHPMAGL